MLNIRQTFQIPPLFLDYNTQSKDFLYRSEYDFSSRAHARETSKQSSKISDALTSKSLKVSDSSKVVLLLPRHTDLVDQHSHILLSKIILKNK